MHLIKARIHHSGYEYSEYFLTKDPEKPLEIARENIITPYNDPRTVKVDWVKSVSEDEANVLSEVVGVYTV